MRETAEALVNAQWHRMESSSIYVFDSIREDAVGEAYKPIFPAVLVSLSAPNAMVGSRQAKYKKKIVDTVL